MSKEVWKAPDGTRFPSQEARRTYLEQQGLLEFSGQESKLLVKHPGEVDGEAFALSNLENCEVIVLDVVAQVTIENLVNCKVFVGPCSGSVFVRKCRGCMFTTVAKQFRVLSSSSCMFFLHVQTDPVIEDSSDLFFGPYNGEDIPVMEGLCGRAGLSLALGEGQWRSVFDFSLEEGQGSGKGFQLVTGDQPLVDVRTASISPLGVYKLRQVFWRFDADRDGGLSFSEVNAFQNAIGSDEVLQDEQAMQMSFAEVGLPLDVNGNLPFESFLRLYEMQGEDEMVSDLSKLGVGRRSIEVFELAAFGADLIEVGDLNDTGETAADDAEDDEVEEEEDYADEGFEVEAEQDWDVLKCAARLCIGARHRGVNLQKWFANYDLEKRATLPKQVFETAFSALLLGLYAGSSEGFVHDMERILERPNLDELCEALADLRNPEHVRYMPLVNKSKGALHHPADPNEVSFFSQQTLQGVEGSVEDFLVSIFHDGLHEPQELFDRVRLAIQAWKWSEAGRLPTKRNAANDYISAANLRNAFRAALQVELTAPQINDFVAMVQGRVESELEVRAREREEETRGSSGAHVTVAALLRWFGTQRLAKAIPREAWLTNKRTRAKNVGRMKREALRAALDGSVEALHALFEDRDDLIEVLHAENIIPEWAAQGEGRARAEAKLESAQGVSQLRKRAARLGGTTKAKEEVAEQLLQEWVAVEADALQRAGALGLLELFYKGRRLGTITTSFEDWMRQRDAERERKRRALVEWQRAKDTELQEHANEESYVILVSHVRKLIRDLVNRTFVQHKDDRSGVIVCRSSRYAGLDIDHKLSVLVKRKADELIAASPKSVEKIARDAASIAAGEVLISQKELKDEFEGLFESLRADPRTAEEALVLLDPAAAAAQRVRELLSTQKGRTELDQRAAKVAEQQPGLDHAAAQERAAHAWRKSAEKEMLHRLGFRKLKSKRDGVNLVKEAHQQRRRKANTEFKRWARKKAQKQKAEARRAAQAKEEEAARERKRRADAKRAYRRWKSAASKNKYYTLAAPSKPSGKPRRVLKPRVEQAQLPRGDTPEWVFDFGPASPTTPDGHVEGEHGDMPLEEGTLETQQ
ncbi:Protein XRP2 [Durusdinium trenchii]|uniref:Protein XRP2 n=1 Tax=Durusdinium trenchii TaxID=1381693 RepID=A0ABP0JH85_9DINO